MTGTSETACAPMWSPASDTVDKARITAFRNWVNTRFELALVSYAEIWAWSVADIDRFWRTVWEYFDIGPALPSGAALATARMPGANWFPDESLNFAQQVLARARRDGPVIVSFDENLNRRELTAAELSVAVMRMASAMRKAGIGPGDRVVASLPNAPEAMIAMLAAASVGAVWSIVSPETGSDGVLARFAQLEPAMLIAVNGYHFRGQAIDRGKDLAAVIAGLPSLRQVVVFQEGTFALPSGAVGWHEFLSDGTPCASPDDFHFAAVAFGHPLWILFSSGTTGVPKAMEQSHGGILLEMLKNAALHLDLGAEDRLFFYTITGWMIWNLMFGALLCGASVVLYSGHASEPTIGRLWRIAELSETTVFGASPSYVKLLIQADYRPVAHHALPALRSVLLSGSPASPECMRWLLDAVSSNIWVQSACGGTDVCTSFVGGVPTLPVNAGEIQARCLGVDAAAFDEDGAEVVGEVGELVIRQPMPSMPVRFWNDPGNQRYVETYFDMYPGMWRQGDFVVFNSRGGVQVLGRSDATLNRHGVRIGTAEIYRALEDFPEVADALVVNVDMPDGDFWMPLFVRMTSGHVLDAGLDSRIRRHLRVALSPRHVPDDVIGVSAIPYTKTGKKLEVPVRRILGGVAEEKAIAREAVDDIGCLDALISSARARMPA